MERELTLDTFHDHFRVLLADDDDDDDINDRINYEINRETNSPILNSPFTTDEVQTCIIKLKITNPQVLITLLINILNTPKIYCAP